MSREEEEQEERGVAKVIGRQSMQQKEALNETASAMWAL